MIRAGDPAEMAPAARKAELAELLAAAYLRRLARQRPRNGPEGLDAWGTGEAECPAPMTTRTAAEGARP